VKIHVLQHVPFEGPAAVGAWAESRGHALEATRFFAEGRLPGIADFDRLVVLGGPMNVYEEDIHPWLAREKQFIGEAVSAGKSVVGICLGAQLIAVVLGAKVRRNPHREIGWFPVTWTEQARRSPAFRDLPEQQATFHWHGDTFDLPEGAVHLARSEACENQAFLFRDRVLGLQFHLESTPESVRLLAENCGDELVPAPHVQTIGEVLSANRETFRKINETMSGILDRLPG